MLFQVVYQYKNKKYYEEFEAKHHNDVKNHIQDLTGCEVLEIREYQYQNKNTKITSTDLQSSSLILKLENDLNFKDTIFLPLKKKTVDTNIVTSYVSSHFKLFSKKITKITKKEVF